MRLLIAISSVTLLITLVNWPAPGGFERSALADSLFDQYGAIRWADEKARLDNFAIQLQHDEKLVGYILVFDSVGGCAGEAQARAIRAKRYVVEHRGISWNRVIWRREGYMDGISTILQPVQRGAMLPFPFRSWAVAGRDGPPTRACKAALERIRKGR